MVTPLDRRQSPRTTMVFDAVVAAEHPLTAIDCSITNISVAGACVWTPTDNVPPEFYLIDVIAQVAYSAEVVWRRAPHVGVRFRSMMLVSDRTAPSFLTAALAQRRVQDTEALMKKQRGAYPVGRAFDLDTVSSDPVAGRRPEPSTVRSLACCATALLIARPPRSA